MILAHDVAGPHDGPALVLLHSSVCDRRMWDGQWAPLVEAGFRVVRPDFRTCGESPAATAPYSDDGDVLAGRDEVRTSRAQISFSERGNIQGAQFFAVAGHVYEQCRERGLGRELPTSWFLQDVRD